MRDASCRVSSPAAAMASPAGGQHLGGVRQVLLQPGQRLNDGIVEHGDGRRPGGGTRQQVAAAPVLVTSDRAMRAGGSVHAGRSVARGTGSSMTFMRKGAPQVAARVGSKTMPGRRIPPDAGQPDALRRGAAAGPPAGRQRVPDAGHQGHAGFRRPARRPGRRIAHLPRRRVFRGGRAAGHRAARGRPRPLQAAGGRGVQRLRLRARRPSGGPLRRGPVHRRGNPHGARPRAARVAPAHGTVPRGGGLRAGAARAAGVRPRLRRTGRGRPDGLPCRQSVGHRLQRRGAAGRRAAAPDRVGGCARAPALRQ